MLRNRTVLFAAMANLFPIPGRGAREPGGPPGPISLIDRLSRLCFFRAPSPAPSARERDLDIGSWISSGCRSRCGGGTQRSPAMGRGWSARDFF